MTDLREQVRQAIWLHRYRVEFGEPTGDITAAVIHPRYDWMGTADAAIAVAEPIIRAQVIEELAQAVIANDPTVVIIENGVRAEGSVGRFLVHWLRAQQEKNR